MTYQQFLARLRSVRRNWAVSHGDFLRARKPASTWMVDCPITAVCSVMTGKEFMVGDWQEAAGLIGLDRGMAKIITESADNGTPFTGCFSEKVRQDLLRATGLTGGK